MMAGHRNRKVPPQGALGVHAGQEPGVRGWVDHVQLRGESSRGTGDDDSNREEGR